MKNLGIAVVGVGHMGRFHCQKVAALHEAGEGVDLVGVVDLDRERGEAVARECQSSYFAKPEEVFGLADAVIVAVPTVYHHAVVGDALRAGLDVLVEKPIASSLEEGEELIELADREGRVLQVGHLERFNPAMLMMKKRIHRPRFIEVHRMGPFPGRATDVDVVRDLMIHDIEIIQDLVGEEPSQIDAVGVPVLSPNHDIASVRLHFPGGCVANLTASRVTPTPMRKLRVFQSDGYFSVDFNEQSGVILRRLTDLGDPEPRIDIEKIELDREDALLAEVKAFVEAVRGRDRPMVSGKEALGALRTAMRVIEVMPPVDELK